jgi:tRNA U34 5-carboxymethylaminomethyl modifying GTPase MnmE/TrmE
MLTNGTITAEMHEAGCVFRTQFRSAALDGMRTTQLIRLAGATSDDVPSRQLDARRHVNRALDALGEIAGKIDNERMLDHLFKTFCIGK